MRTDGALANPDSEWIEPDRAKLTGETPRAWSKSKTGIKVEGAVQWFQLPLVVITKVFIHAKVISKR